MSLGLSKPLLDALAAKDYSHATPIQRFIWSQNSVGKALSSVPMPDYSDLVQPERGQPVT